MWSAILVPLFVLGDCLSPCAKEGPIGSTVIYTLFCPPPPFLRAVGDYFSLGQHSSHITMAQKDAKRSPSHCSACWFVPMLT